MNETTHDAKELPGLLVEARASAARLAIALADKARGLVEGAGTDANEIACLTSGAVDALRAASIPSGLNAAVLVETTAPAPVTQRSLRPLTPEDVLASFASRAGSVLVDEKGAREIAAFLNARIGFGADEDAKLEAALEEALAGWARAVNVISEDLDQPMREEREAIARLRSIVGPRDT